MNNIIIILVVLALLVYLVFRQFTEQQVNWSNLLLLPALSAYASYTELVPAFAHFAALPLIAGLAVGALAGLATGIVRGRNTRVRLDSASGLIYSKPQLISSLTWVSLMLIRAAVIALGYTPLAHTLLAGVLIAFGGTVFLVSIATQKFMVFLYSNRLQASSTGLPRQPYSLRNR